MKSLYLLMKLIRGSYIGHVLVMIQVVLLVMNMVPLIGRITEATLAIRAFDRHTRGETIYLYSTYNNQPSTGEFSSQTGAPAWIELQDKLNMIPGIQRIRGHRSVMACEYGGNTLYSMDSYMLGFLKTQLESGTIPNVNSATVSDVIPIIVGSEFSEDVLGKEFLITIRKPFPYTDEKSNGGEDNHNHDEDRDDGDSLLNELSVQVSVKIVGKLKTNALIPNLRGAYPPMISDLFINSDDLIFISPILYNEDGSFFPVNDIPDEYWIIEQGYEITDVAAAYNAIIGEELDESVLFSVDDMKQRETGWIFAIYAGMIIRTVLFFLMTILSFIVFMLVMLWQQRYTVRTYRLLGLKKLHLRLIIFVDSLITLLLPAIISLIYTYINNDTNYLPLPVAALPVVLSITVAFSLFGALIASGISRRQTVRVFFEETGGI